MTTWIIEVKPCRDKAPLWIGNIDGRGLTRHQINDAARALAHKHFDMEIAKVVRICKGRVDVQFAGAPEAFE